MKKEQRVIFLELAYEVDTGLCVFCKYSKCEGGISPCDHGESYCTHKLRDELPEEDIDYPHTDCWGFKNNFDVSFCADNAANQQSVRVKRTEERHDSGNLERMVEVNQYASNPAKPDNKKWANTEPTKRKMPHLLIASCKILTIF